MTARRTHDHSVSATVRINASPSVIFDVLADPRRHPEIDGSGTLRGVLVGPERLTLGAAFGMSMKYWGLPYRITNTVVEFEADRLIAWAHLSRVIWRYELRPVQGGTEVVETWDPGPSPAREVYAVLGFPARTAAAMVATLERLRRRVEV